MSLIDKTTGDLTLAALGQNLNYNPQAHTGATGTVFLDGSQVVISGTLLVNGVIINPGGSPNPIFQSNLLTIDAIPTPTDSTANSGGLLLKGTTDKSLRWYINTNAWTSDVNFDLSNITSAYYINGVMVLNATSLGSGIIIDGGSF